MRQFKIVIQYSNNTYSTFYSATETQAMTKVDDHKKWHEVVDFTISEM